MADEKEVKETEKAEVTFTEEQKAYIEANYVKKEDAEKIVKDYNKLIGAFNKLLEEYNALHVKTLINTVE